MFGLLALWAALFGVVGGWGLLVRWSLARIGGASFARPLSTFQTLWLGFAGLLAFLLVCSLVLPIGVVVLVATLVLALAGYVLQRDHVARILRAMRRGPRLRAVIACTTVVLALFVAYSASDVVHLYDTGLYHLQILQWSESYAAVPGLANLHLRLGYNNSIHLFGALTDALWEDSASHATNGFLLLAALTHWVTEILTARTPRGRLRQAYCLITLPYLLAKLWSMDVASLSSDLPLAIICLVIVLEIVSLPRASAQRLVLPLALILALGALATTIKLGGGSLFVVSVGLAIIVLRRNIGRVQYLVLFALPALLVIAWMARGVILSGWLVFPVIGKLPLEWAVRKKVATAHLLEIQSWGRIMGQGPEQVFGHGFWHWFRPWFGEFRQSKEFILLAISSVLLVWRAAQGPRFVAARRVSEWCAVAACTVGIAQWFLGAPNLRYGDFLFWMLAAVLFASLIGRALRDATARTLVLTLSLAMTWWSGGFSAYLNAAGPDYLTSLPEPRMPATVPTSLGPGTEIVVPTESDQCWAARIPCSPQGGKQTLRDPDDLGAGYLPAPRR